MRARIANVLFLRVNIAYPQWSIPIAIEGWSLVGSSIEVIGVL